MNRASFEAVPGRGAEQGEGVGDTPSEELDEFGGEPFVESAHAEDGVGDPLVVGVAKRLDGALELGSRFEDEGGEEGDRVEFSMPLDDVSFSGDARDHPRGKDGEERHEVVVGRGARVRRWGGAPDSGLPRWMGHPIEVGSPHEPTRFHWKIALTEDAWKPVVPGGGSPNFLCIHRRLDRGGRAYPPHGPSHRQGTIHEGSRELPLQEMRTTI